MKNFTPPLSDELFEKYNFFELYPFDGGGYFIQKEIIGSLNDKEITKRILNGALHEFGPLEELDFTRFERWDSIEKSCWINRMYFIVSMARCAMLENDVSLARKIAGIIRRFNRVYPPPATKIDVRALEREVRICRDRDYNSGNATGEIPYQWYDFQPASRIINGIHAAYFLRKFKMPDEEFEQFIRNNALVILFGDDEHHLEKGNHQALRGLALLYAGHFLDEPDYIRAGSAVCNFHMIQDYYPDGMLIDMSPSYHVFEAWIGRDAVSLGKIIPEARKMLKKAFRICREFRQPNGFSIVLNDGYPLDMRGFLESISKNVAPDRMFVLPHSGMAFYHSPNIFAALDATPCCEKHSHYHGGKNGVTLWFGDKPFLVDSGCCNYDDGDFWKWFKQPCAHSTLLVNGKGDSKLRGRYEWVRTEKYRITTWNSNSVGCTSPHWQRRMTIVSPQKIVISEQVRQSKISDMEFLFILHPSVVPELEGDQILLSNGKWRLAMRWETDSPVSWSISEGKFFAADSKKTNFRLHCSAHAIQLNLCTHWVLMPVK